MPQDHLFAEILDAFAQLEKWIPGCGTWPVDLMIGKLPDANPADIYRLADAWGEAATRLTDYYYDVQHSADPITDNWQGDGAPMAFNMAWNQHLQDVADVAQSMGAMQMIVQNYGLELETEEFFIAFTLITLLVQAIIAIVSAFFSGGISLGGLGAAYAAARIGIKEAFEACMRALVRLGEMLATGELKKVLSRTAIKDFLKVAGRDLAGRGAAALRNAPRALGTAVKDGVKELGPRRILARAAADRAAAQFRRDIMRSVLRKELRKQLMEVGTKAEAKAAIRALDKAAAELGQRMAADLRNQLFEKFAGRSAARLGGRELAHLGEHEAFRIAEHYGERGLANTTRGMLDTFIERQLERTTMLGTAGRYVGELAFAGAKFMGGVDFGAQAFELVTGERSSIDMQEVAFSLGQGALMGGGMFGHGVLGKMVTGGFAGVATAAATDGAQLAIATIKGEKADIHWGDDMWRGARDGVRMGLVFSAPHALAGAATHVVPHFGERPGGHQTFALNDSRLGTNVWTGDTRTGAGGYTSEHGGIGWRLADGSFVHLGSDGSVIASHRAGGEPTGGGPTRDGGGSRTSVIERPTPTRSVEGGGGGPRSTERALPPGHGEGGADHTQTTHTSTDHTSTDRTSTDRTSTVDHTQTDRTSTDHTSTDHTSPDRTQTDRTQTDHTSTGDRGDHTQTDRTQTDQTQTDRTQADHTRTDRAQTDHAGTTERDHSQTTDRTNDADRTTDRTNDGDGTQTVDRTQTDHRPAEQPRAEQPRTEVRDEQVAARHPQATHERPPVRTHAEEVLARVDDTRTPEALRAEQQTHLGEPEAGRPGHTVEHVERQMQDLAVQGRSRPSTGTPSRPGRVPRRGCRSTPTAARTG
ncbi:WXG100 family type VII secretion target [Dactylosporangium darangshiense]|uniref:WXG100 family type VII secretion target n=1 Tax=Dactylosporangium darangshiense TaxID=579108 RepID=UPI003637D1AD